MRFVNGILMDCELNACNAVFSVQLTIKYECAAPKNTSFYLLVLTLILLSHVGLIGFPLLIIVSVL